MNDVVNHALSAPFVHGMSRAQQAVLKGIAQPVTFLEDQFVFRFDEPADHFWVITDGRVGLEIASAQGATTIQTVGANQVLGFSWLFEPHRWQFDAQCLSLVHAAQFDGKALRQACEDDHELGYQLMDRFANVVVRRLQQTRMQLMDVYA